MTRRRVGGGRALTEALRERIGWNKRGDQTSETEERVISLLVCDVPLQTDGENVQFVNPPRKT